MSFTVRNNSSSSEFAVNDGETILDAALRQGHIFPYSCRDGLCATCKADLLHGRVEYGDYQHGALSDAEIEQGKVLLCQARPLENIVIEAQEIAAAASIDICTLPCRVTRLTALAHDVMEVHLTLPQERRLSYLAGQYIDMLLRDGRRRSFSLATRPGAGVLQLHVRRVAGGRFTSHVFERMKVRDLLRLQGPLGTFFLRTDSDRPLLLMAGGTGFAPIKSILEQAFGDGITRPMHLFWGVRSRRDLYFDELARDWAQSNANFQYTPVLSEPLPQDEWQGETGWVHDAVVQRYPDLSQYDVYASGPPPMIDAGKLAFDAHGLPEARLFYDSFEFANEPRRGV